MKYIIKLMWLGPLQSQPFTENSEDSDFSSILRNYEDIFDETVLPVMSGRSFKITLKPNATPNDKRARKITVPYLEQLKKQLQEMEQLGVISLHDKPSPSSITVVSMVSHLKKQSQIAVTEGEFGRFHLKNWHPHQPWPIEIYQGISLPKKPHGSSLMVWISQPAWQFSPRNLLNIWCPSSLFLERMQYSSDCLNMIMPSWEQNLAWLPLLC